MALRLRDRQSQPWMRPGGRFITLSGAALKWTGLLLTCLSSLGVAVFQRGLLRMDEYATLEDLSAAMADPANGLMSLASAAVSCSLIAAMAIPLYAKLVFEGWKQAEDRNRFFLRLFLCALASEIPYDFAMNGKLLEFGVQNPAWGLLLCAVMLEVLRMRKPKSRAASALLQILVVAGALAWALLLRVYLGTTLVLLVAMFYFLEGNKNLTILGGILFTLPQFPAPLGMMFVHWYEPGEKKPLKYPALFHALYPLQLLVFGLIGMAMRG